MNIKFVLLSENSSNIPIHFKNKYLIMGILMHLLKITLVGLHFPYALFS